MTNIKDDVVCYCSGTTKEQIKALMVHDLDLISRETGACSGCGSCDVAIKDILAQSWQSNVHST